MDVLVFWISCLYLKLKKCHHFLHLWLFFFKQWQSWIANAYVKSWLIGKDSDAGRDWGQEKGTTEDEMAGWHQWLDGHEFEWTPGVGDGQGGLACCNSWGRKESDTTERLNWTELNFRLYMHSPNYFRPYPALLPGIQPILLRIQSSWLLQTFFFFWHLLYAD